MGRGGWVLGGSGWGGRVEGGQAGCEQKNGGSWGPGVGLGVGLVGLGWM